jgi:hypothetical protein
VGSKPRPLQNSLERNYMDMSLGSNEWGAAGSSGTAAANSGEKCSSAPHLPPEDGAGAARRNDSTDDYYRANSELFMEVEFGSAHNLPVSDSAVEAAVARQQEEQEGVSHCLVMATRRSFVYAHLALDQRTCVRRLWPAVLWHERITRVWRLAAARP